MPLFALVATTLTLTPTAKAQLRGDLGVYAGASQRVLNHPSGGGALIGPTLGLEGHLAFFPLVRVGAYLHGEISPTNDQVASREMLGGGLRIKFIPPWPRGDWRMWGALGLGYVGVYSPAYSQTIGTTTKTNVSVDSAGGGFFEVPLAFGVEYRHFKPFMIFAELTTRFGFGFTGSLYGANGGRGAKTDAGAPEAILSNGTDLFAVGLAIGVGFDL